MPLAPGSRLGRFEIASILGEGAMGIVYLAHDPHIDRPVALKTLRQEASLGEHGAEVKSRFLKEAKLAGRLAHPNIVTIYEAGEDKGVTYIAMEYVDGLSLTQWLAAHHEVSYAERLDIVRKVAQALEHAHERGVLHRDIKPGNVLLARDGRVKVADFGIGKLLSGTGDLTRTGQMIGSPAYMSPEQIRGDKLDGRSDLFSLAVVLYELLTGKRPFPGDSITTLVYQILHTEPKDPRELRSDLPASTRDVFARLLAKVPEQRPADAAAFLRDIRRIEEELTAIDLTMQVPPPLPKEPPRPTPSVLQGPPTVVSTPGAAASAPSAPRSFGPSYLLAAAFLVLAAALFLWVWKLGLARGERTASVQPIPTALPATPREVATPVWTPQPTPAALPTRGPEAAADVIVGAPRVVNPQASRRAPTAVAAESLKTASRPGERAGLPAEESPGAEASRSAAAPPADGVYRTRRFAKFSLSPDQARIYLDDRYVGIADDWDDRGGGKTLPVGREGVHHVRLELPGYRTLRLDVIASASAGDDTVDVDGELQKESSVSFPKIPKLDDRTVGPVAFQADPPDATVSEGDKTLGNASSFSSESPLRLSGPGVHDLSLAAPGRKPKTVRILVAENAGRDVAKVKVTLKKE